MKIKATFKIYYICLILYTIKLNEISEPYKIIKNIIILKRFQKERERERIPFLQQCAVYFIALKQCKLNNGWDHVWNFV